MGKTEIIARNRRRPARRDIRTRQRSARSEVPRIYMGAKTIERQSPNVFRMRLMGAGSDSGAQQFRHAEKMPVTKPAARLVCSSYRDRALYAQLPRRARIRSRPSCVNSSA